MDDITRVFPATPLNSSISVAIYDISVGYFDHAISLLQKLLAKEPTNIDAMFHLGVALDLCGKWREAITVLDGLISIQPYDKRAWFQLGVIYKRHDLISQAAACADVACRIDPKSARFTWDRCQNFLSLGDFKRGWEGCESRLSSQLDKDWMRPTIVPYYQGEPPENVRLLLFCEQGVGDNIMHMSVLAEFAPLFKHIILDVDPRLEPIVKRSFPNIETISAWNGFEREKAYERIDFQLPALQSVSYFRGGFEDFPDRALPYLMADPRLARFAREKYEPLANGRPIIGLSWRSTTRTNAEAKSIPLEELETLCREDVFFVSLQNAVNEQEMETLKKFGVYFDPEIDGYKELDDHFAQVAAMDAVISISNTVLHMAGAQAVPTMAIIPGGAARHWYWFLRRHDCPWYPSVRLFRPEPETDGGKWWATSLKRIAVEIRSARAEAA